MALDNTRPTLDKRIEKLHEALIAATGGPTQAGELQAPYWTVDATDFQKFLQDLIAEPVTDAKSGDGAAGAAAAPTARVGPAPAQPTAG